jgi:DNA-binding NarL/FixJ family response regulator
VQARLLGRHAGRCPEAWQSQLTPRQLEIAAYLLRGAANADIAARLSISRRTVEKHVERILYALGAANRRELILVAQENT